MPFAIAYQGSSQVAVPTALTPALNAAISGGGTAYYGIYHALNEAVTVQATGGGAGSLTLLIEPKTAMPTSSTDAQNQIRSFFPGVGVSLAEVSASATGYVLAGTDGATSYTLGFVSYDGIPLAYVLSGSGTFQRVVPRG